jgi:hypothetical protein
VNFLFPKPPVFSESNTRQSLRRTFACPPVNPGRRNLQKLGHVVNSKQMALDYVFAPRGRAG